MDWTNPLIKLTDHFTVKEALWLPTWGRLATSADGLDEVTKANLVKLFHKMDQIRETLGKPINVHVSYRPAAYNAQIGGAQHSAHVLGLACDFDAGEDCDATRATLEPLLEQLGVRMERKPGSGWVHIDLMSPHPNRYFIP